MSSTWENVPEMNDAMEVLDDLRLDDWREYVNSDVHPAVVAAWATGNISEEYWCAGWMCGAGAAVRGIAIAGDAVDRIPESDILLLKKLLDELMGCWPEFPEHGQGPAFRRLLPDKWSYENCGTPDDYVCGVCGAKNQKLWRAYQSFDIDLHCAKCVQEKTGRQLERHGHEIGWYVAAVPDEEGFAYWGYSSVPEAGVKWWEALPGWYPAQVTP